MVTNILQCSSICVCVCRIELARNISVASRYKDGQMVIESERIKIVKESENSFSLVIERVLIEDSGSYSVVAANSLGQMSEFWSLVANSPPAFLQSLLKNAEVTEGESITFEVKVDGNPKPKVAW